MKHLLYITSLLLAATLLSGCGGSDEAAVAKAPKAVKMVTVKVASTDRELSFPAEIRSVQSANLTFQAGGEVVELNVLEGSEVQKGAIIAKQDPRDARNALTQAEAEFANAQTEYRRAQRLLEEDAISRSTAESRQTTRDVRAAAVDTARDSLEDTTLYAPFTGAISRVYIEQFQNVQPQEIIATIQSRETEAVIDVPGSLIARIPQLEPVGTRVVLDAAPGVEIPATFRESSGTADPSTQTYEITFTFEPPENLVILPGMTATIKSTFRFSGAEDIVPTGIAVPISAVFAIGEDTFVWVVDPADQTLSQRLVSVGPDAGSSVTITDGLEDNETIVAAGVSFLSEGMQVTEWQPQ